MLTFLEAVKRVLVGKPFASDRLRNRSLPKRLAMPVFSASALSSVAYAPDEILLTLALAGVASVAISPWVGLAVIAVLLVVVASYRQAVHAYPSGGGDYEIAKRNIGPRAGTTVASALMIDYLLTVAVSVSAAAQYVVSLAPALEGARTTLAVLGVAVLVLLNLRGITRGVRARAVLTYAFLAGIAALCVTGIVQAATGTLAQAPSARFEIVPDAALDAGLVGLAGALLILRAFSAGAAALTGLEGPGSNVPRFEAPQARNAATTLVVLGIVSAAMLAGVIYLANAARVHVVQDPSRQLLLDGGPVPEDYIQAPVVSQLARTVFDAGSPAFYLVVAATALILMLAGHAAFNAFPVLASILATDGYLPRQLRTRGDRLTFSNGILALGLGAVVLILVFRADVTALVQLYIVGVFVSFTGGQLGLIRHWNRTLRSTVGAQNRWAIHKSRAINSLGFALTAAVLVVVLVTKFEYGAWIAVLAMAILFAVMRSIKKHYDAVAAELAIDDAVRLRALPSRVHAVILVSHLRKPVLRALAFARASRPSRLDAVTVDVDPEQTRRTLADWEKYEIPVPITVLASPYRDTITPILDYIRTMRRDSPRDLIVVYIPEYVVGKWWEQLVHNQTALRIKARLHFVPGVMVASVPWQLASSDAAQIYQDLK
ncbi:MULTISPECIES: APC family permease [unclassified Arthrobacter]|uniref:APC family permease n=1 Tax=Arthrobacter sp. Leaf234 TaxID=1736303 RepID=UPI0006F1F31F|nr:APC family permease [Arthrobacter sp. Leaf234]KQN99728.1 DNA-binding protein [Arthrobacter sp. Leaf234]